MDKELLDSVTQALSLDAQGQHEKAVSKYLSSLHQALLILSAKDTSDVQHRQVVLIGSNCLERISDLLASSTGALENYARKSIDQNLSNIRRMHEDEQMSKIQLKRSPSLTSPASSHPSSYKHQGLFQQRVKALLSVREERRERLSGQKVLDWMRSTFNSIDLSNLLNTSVLSRFTTTVGSAEELSIQDAVLRGDTIVLSRVIAAFMTHQKDHPVVQLTDDFIRRLDHLLGPECTGSRQEIADELHLFTRHFCSWFEQQYGPGVSSLGAELGMQEYIFGTGAYNLLFPLYLYPKDDCDDMGMNRKLTCLGWKETVTRIGLSAQYAGKLQREMTVFPVSSDPPALRPALAMFTRIMTARSPHSKLQVLLKTCTELCRAFPDPSNVTGQPEIGAEDLMRLLALVLVRSCVGWRMRGEAAFMGDLVPEGVLNGEAGYVLATLQAAMDFCLQL